MQRIYSSLAGGKTLAMDQLRRSGECTVCLLAWVSKVCPALSSHNCKLSSRSWRLKEQLSSVKSALDSSRLSNCIKTSSKRSGKAFRSACRLCAMAEKAAVSRLSTRNCAKALCSCWHSVRARSMSGFGRYAGTAGMAESWLALRLRHALARAPGCGQRPA